MKRTTFFMLIALLLTLPVNSAEQTQAGLQLRDGNAECTGDNLLVNPSFEGAYSSYLPPNGHPDCEAGVCTTAQMADGWTPFWVSQQAGDEQWENRMPEYKPALSLFTNPPRVRSGERAQQWFTFFSTHDAGVYQQVGNVTAGSPVCFSVWGHAWSSDGDSTTTDPNNNGNLAMQIGIDPTGGTDWQSSTVEWTTPVTRYDEYGLFKLETTAQADSVTVFMHSNPQFPVKHNDVYWDDAIMTQPADPISPANMVVITTTQTITAAPNTQQTGTISIALNNVPDEFGWFARVLTGDFIQLQQTEGANTDNTLTFTVDSSGLTAGTYQGEIQVDAADPSIDGGTNIVPITLEVVAPQSTEPSMSIRPTVITHVASQAAVYDFEVLVELNNVPDDFQWFAGVDPTSQFFPTLTPEIGDSATQTLTISIDTTGFASGTYQALVTIGASDPTIAGGSKAIPIRLTVLGEKIYLPILNRY